MKNNSRFISIIALALLASVLLLTGGMYAITAKNGAAKPYDMNAMSSVSSGITGLETDDAPTSQTDLRKKFAAMSEIDTQTNTITVITKDYLYAYWAGNYEKEEIRSLTTEEVLYIIQDSIHLYFSGGYQKIILPGYRSVSSQTEIARRFPDIAGKEYDVPVRNVPQDLENVYGIILHRLLLLSSPGAFIPGTDTSSSFDPVYYIPGFSAETDREFLLHYFSGSMNSIPDPDWIPDFFSMGILGDSVIAFHANDYMGEVYPTAELESRYFVTLQTEHGDNGCQIHIDLRSGCFYLSASASQSFCIIGSFERVGDKLLLKAQNAVRDQEVVYVLQREDDHFVSLSEQPGMGLKKGLVLHAGNNAFWDILADYTPPQNA